MKKTTKMFSDFEEIKRKDISEYPPLVKEVTQELCEALEMHLEDFWRERNCSLPVQLGAAVEVLICLCETPNTRKETVGLLNVAIDALEESKKSYGVDESNN